MAAQQVATVVEHEVLEQLAGQPLPKQPPDEPIDEPGRPAPKEGTQPKGGSLPKSGGAMAPSALLLDLPFDRLTGSSYQDCHRRPILGEGKA
jgi:hypothetical protein